MKKIKHHHDIFTIENFLTKEECLAFIQTAEKVSFEEAKVNIGGKQTKLKGVRNNERIMFKDENLAEEIWQKIRQGRYASKPGGIAIPGGIPLAGQYTGAATYP